MPGKIFLSTAYLPPVEYISLISKADETFIEREENYLKQSFRNRCYILSPGGRHLLTVPVYLGSFHKTAIRDIRIDYSKRWQQVHLRALTSSYASAPYYLYYFETFERILQRNQEFLLDLNMELLEAIITILKLHARISFTTNFVLPGNADNDFRYRISPKNKSDHNPKPYIQVFRQDNGFSGGLSIVDMLFNIGPDSINYL